MNVTPEVKQLVDHAIKTGLVDEHTMDYVKWHEKRAWLPKTINGHLVFGKKYWYRKKLTKFGDRELVLEKPKYKGYYHIFADSITQAEAKQMVQSLQKTKVQTLEERNNLNAQISKSAQLGIRRGR